MASELSPVEHEIRNGGETRRSFLVKLGIGAAALGLVAGALSSMRGIGGRSGGATSMNTEFPGEDSIFHPAVDPRKDPRRSRQRVAGA